MPASLLIDCPIPELSGSTYRDLAELAAKRRSALVDCNMRLKAARTYLAPAPVKK